MQHKLFLILFLVLSAPALAQNTIVFTAEATTGIETVTPVLTWDTIPLADGCVASGDWSGAKGGAGTETLPPITADATYNLECQWLDVTATLSWTAPTQNTDGTALVDLAGFKIYYGQTQSGPYDNIIDLVDPLATTHVIEPLSSGNWFFVATAYNAADIESVVSNEAMKNLGLIGVTDSIGITINARPGPPSNLNIE